MTDKERLEEIKGRYMEFEYDFNLRKEDIEWLIEQADRGVEYDRYLISLEDNKHYVTGLEQQNKRYREALEFYANKINYLTFIENGKSNIEHDQGEKARKALGSEENEMR